MNYRTKLLKNGEYLAQQRRYFIWKTITDIWGNSHFDTESGALKCIKATVDRIAAEKARIKAAKTYTPIIIEA